ncbi:putative MFS family arabinose efflux permease [Agrobacterium tumefaciens]|uniref:MFS transporter n=1 Tax=Agrobacterium tumefaciens TaxID=358 RepID=UPI001AE92402|nr:MFS transporter [Agrobacterium tumefaciens]MBP2508303.1 putative MFS family arabinose efflux permease [Agrobacterium tumefaciens]MBP2517455.1 putative MFS family arabinose efflux permease [Agrobacterium tumefaciens]MBP2576089.1 putative MFS family arabinose efflux permease [Agrobacterium tumefaciens]MBP2594445.1 putative MFS family arabinose efflux permease [Agrobacterium tumefaciens]
MTTRVIEGDDVEATSISPALTFLLATACGLIAANLYYGQPLAGIIGAELGLSVGATGLIVTLTQIGYGIGLLFVVPLGDLVENRKLVVSSVAMAVLSLVGAAFAPHAAPFLIAAFLVGVSSVAVQVIVPYAAHMAPHAIRGRVVGNVMSGLMAGIMLARPVSSLLSEVVSWRGVFLTSAAVMALLAVVLFRLLPTRMPDARLTYGALMASMGRLALHTPILRRRAIYHAFLFAAFSLFWTTTPLYLSGPHFNLSQGEIALFALAGAAGTVAAPIAGRMADRGWTRAATFFALVAVALSFAVTHLAPEGSHLALAILVVAAIVLDFGVTTNLVLGQRAIFTLGAEFRSRLNGIYMATFFMGGAIGSAVGGWAYAVGEWQAASWIGFALPVAALLYFLTEKRD